MADLKVISSFHESFSFAALEAMATGLPLVVTRTEWIPRLIGEDQGGMVVPNDDAAAFAQAMLEIYRDEIVDNAPLGRLGTPPDIAGAAIYLASRAGAYVNGAVIPIDGGTSAK